MNPATIGRELARRRRAAGLTQSEVARRMGTTQSVVARAEADWTTMPRLEFLDRFARATGKPWRLTLGGPEPGLATVARRAERALGSFEFDPWRRDPAEPEARSLHKDGLAAPPGRSS